MKEKILVMLVVVMAFSCSAPEKKSPVFSFEDLIVDTLVLEKDPMTKSLGSDFTFIQTDSGSILQTFSDHTLFSYSYPEGKILKKVEFEKEGPDGIGDFISGSLIDSQSIWFLSNNRLLEATQNGRVKRTIALPEAPMERLAANYATFPHNEMKRFGSKLLIPDVPFVFKEEFKDYKKWLLVIDLESGKQEYWEFPYPDGYEYYAEDHMLGPYNHHYHPETEKLLVSFPASDSIYIASEGQEKWFLADAGESFQILPGSTSTQGEWTVFQPNPNSGRYTWIDFDPLAEVYLRQVTLSPGNSEEGRKSKNKLLIYNSEFEQIGEIKLRFEISGFSGDSGYFFRLGSIHSEDEVSYVRVDFSKMK